MKNSTNLLLVAFLDFLIVFTEELVDMFFDLIDKIFEMVFLFLHNVIIDWPCLIFIV